MHSRAADAAGVALDIRMEPKTLRKPPFSGERLIDGLPGILATLGAGLVPETSLKPPFDEEGWRAL